MPGPSLIRTHPLANVLGFAEASPLRLGSLAAQDGGQILHPLCHSVICCGEQGCIISLGQFPREGAAANIHSLGVGV